ncbi:MAG: hypothetical protein M1827_005332 [Pycnora praestabilis]|nr:MAG: hypothetical protein M1827_005332 [Pycnora praestabilis]
MTSSTTSSKVPQHQLQQQQQRQPPPSLFLGPPSRNASTLSLPSLVAAHGTHPPNLPGPTPSSQRVPLLRERSTRNVPHRLEPDPNSNPRASLSPLGRALPRQQQQQAEGQRQADRIDSLWAEMQSTLEEVELSAVSATHVFGSEHSRALEDLRTAQIALAQAWARSEADEAVDHAENDERVVRGAGLLGSEEGVGGSGGTGGVSTGSPAAGKEKAGIKLEEETEGDVLLARKRREANDRYFQRVNGGVLDVVAKLEEVAIAMRSVEQESRDIWSDSDSADTSPT